MWKIGRKKGIVHEKNYNDQKVGDVTKEKLWELHNFDNLLNKVKQIIQNKSQSAKSICFLETF